MRINYYTQGMRDSLQIFGVLLIIAAIVVFIAVPWHRSNLHADTINTYHHQAVLAANPEQFSAALHNLDQSLEHAGMVRGNTIFPLFSNGSQDDMAYKRSQYLLLASRGDKLASLELSSTEVSVGMQEMKVTLKRIQTSSVAFWVWHQGGALYFFGVPLLMFVGAIASFIVSAVLPTRIHWQAPWLAEGGSA